MYHRPGWRSCLKPGFFSSSWTSRGTFVSLSYLLVLLVLSRHRLPHPFLCTLWLPRLGRSLLDPFPPLPHPCALWFRLQLKTAPVLLRAYLIFSSLCSQLYRALCYLTPPSILAQNLSPEEVSGAAVNHGDGFCVFPLGFGGGEGPEVGGNHPAALLNAL